MNNEIRTEPLAKKEMLRLAENVPDKAAGTDKCPVSRGASDFHRIVDIEVATFLATVGERLKGIRANGLTAEFYFYESPKLRQAIADFEAGAASPPRNLLKTLKLMTSLAKTAMRRSKTNPKKTIQGGLHESRQYC